MLPAHLKRYVVEQDYSRYTPEDQEVWRYIMHQLKDFLSKHAHPCYAEGLAKTGIEIDRIPRIEEISAKIEKFGWRAVPVSGFIPPAAFMEIQALGFLPIASDMRTVDHLQYTPAPDIVHEAAGHAPILVNEEFAGYLKAYAQVARKAIISRQDMQQYEAIRLLSDLKEDPNSTSAQIIDAEVQLGVVSNAITSLSEAAHLSRMNWWTAEYGLIGTLEDPKLYGAGLLSSVSEARSCLDPKVKKIPFTLDCINYSYDITEPQPQLFVTPDFKSLTVVLEQLADTMAFRRGGSASLEKARLSQTVNTVELNSGLQIAGQLKAVLFEGAYLQFSGPCQLGCADSELSGHGSAYHKEGYGSPVGLLTGQSKCLSEFSATELAAIGLVKGSPAVLKYASGVLVSGKVTGFTRSIEGRLLLVAFADCKVTQDEQVLFDPSWGTFDMAVGSTVVSVSGGPVDRLAYGEFDDFVNKVVPRKLVSADVQFKHKLYKELRELREGLSSGQIAKDAHASKRAALLLENFQTSFPHDWLARVALYEVSKLLPSESWQPLVEAQLRNIGSNDEKIKAQIQDGLRLIP